MISALVLVAGILTKNLKTYEQVKDFFNATNMQSISEASFKEKHHTFIGMQILCHYHIGLFSTL